MPNPNKELLLHFAQLKIQIGKYEKEVEMIKDQVQEEIEALMPEGMDQLALQELPGYSYSLAKARAKWEYSPTLQAVEADLIDMKKDEEATGKATNLNDGKKELRFNQPKE